MPNKYRDLQVPVHGAGVEVGAGVAGGEGVDDGGGEVAGGEGVAGGGGGGEEADLTALIVFSMSIIPPEATNSANSDFF